jgi:HlyD family secretion protein
MNLPFLPRRAPVRLITLGTLAAVLIVALLYVARQTGPLAPVRVTVTTARSAEIQPALFGIGTVEARKTYLLGPTSAGRVLRVLVEVGDAVAPGQLLAEMDPVDFASRVSALEAARARASSATTAAQAQVQDALSRRALADANARRYIDLSRQGFMSPGAVEAREQELQSATAVVQAAQANLQAARQEQDRLQAEHQALLQQRNNLRLHAPAQGVVVAREAEPGSTVVAGQAVLRLIDPDSLWVRTRFDQGRSGALRTGLPASVRLRSRPDTPLEGQVERVEWLGDSVTEERVAHVALATASDPPSLGELAEVTLALPAAGPTLVVPNAAIRRHDGQAGAWLLEDGGLRFAPLRLGVASLDGQVQVLEGLSDGAQVVVYSEKPLSADARIQVVPTLTGQRP